MGRHSPSLPSWWCVGLQMDCPITRHPYRGTTDGLSRRHSLPSWWCVGLFMDCPIARHSYRDGAWDYSWTVPSPVTPIVGLQMDCPITRHLYRGTIDGLSRRPSLPSWWCVGLQMDCPISHVTRIVVVCGTSWTVPSHVTRVVVVCGTIHGLSHRPSLPSWWCVGLFMDCPISHVTLIVVISRATDRIKPIHAPW